MAIHSPFSHLEITVAQADLLCKLQTGSLVYSRRITNYCVNEDFNLLKTILCMCSRQFWFNSWSRSTVFQDRFGPTKLGVARVDLVVSIMLQGSSLSMCSHKPVWIYTDKRKFEFEFSVFPCDSQLLVIFNDSMLIVTTITRIQRASVI